MKTELNGRHILVADEKTANEAIEKKLKVALHLLMWQKNTQQIQVLQQKGAN